MNCLLDVNVILASRWMTHQDHVLIKAWIESLDAFCTCSISELGFIRISLSPAYRATWSEVQESLKKLHARKGHMFSADDVDGSASPETGSKQTTDAHLVALAKRHNLRLATLDGELLAANWAVGIAANPLLAKT